MMSINNLSGEDLFDRQSVPIVVLNFEHHGNGGSHSHSFYELVYIERGFSLHMYNNITTILTPGDMFAVRPGDVHGYTSANHTHLYNCLFFSEALEKAWSEVIDLPGIHKVFDKKESSIWKRIHLDFQGRKQAVEYLERMKWERINKSPGWELNLKSLLTGFLILFSRTYDDRYGYKANSEQKYFQYVYNALDFIEDHIKEDISVNDIASVAGLSNDYLSRQFKQFTGMAPIEYIKNFRFAKAVEILKDTTISVSDVASEVGFEDPAYFARQFRQLLGMSPSEYRKMEVKGLGYKSVDSR
jgi:AraC-like DNA-binding protein/quercetin dioxygenase-like cupin family protein